MNPAYPDHPTNRRASTEALAGGKVLTVFSVAALEVALKQAVLRFEQTSEWQVALYFNTAPELMAKLRDGWRADVWIAPAPVLKQAAGLGRVGTHLPLAQVHHLQQAARQSLAAQFQWLQLWSLEFQRPGLLGMQPAGKSFAPQTSRTTVVRIPA